MQINIVRRDYYVCYVYLTTIKSYQNRTLRSNQKEATLSEPLKKNVMSTH